MTRDRRGGVGGTDSGQYASEGSAGVTVAARLRAGVPMTRIATVELGFPCSVLIKNEATQRHRLLVTLTACRVTALVPSATLVHPFVCTVRAKHVAVCVPSRLTSCGNSPSPSQLYTLFVMENGASTN